MVCPKCGKEFSDKVYRVHKERCKDNVQERQEKGQTEVRASALVHTEENHTKDELIELAELAGIDIDKRWGKHRIVQALNGE